MQRRQNATRLCDHIVSAQCLMQKTPEECIALMLAGNSSRAEASAAGIDQRKAVAIAVPVAVGGVCAASGEGVAHICRFPVIFTWHVSLSLSLCHSLFAGQDY
jgi:hypothetical protein